MRTLWILAGEKERLYSSPTSAETLPSILVDFKLTATHYLQLITIVKKSNLNKKARNILCDAQNVPTIIYTNHAYH